MAAPLATAVAGYTAGKLRELRRKAGERERTDEERQAALAQGVGLLLRAHLAQLHAEWAASGLPCPEQVKREATEVYRAYHALGLNGVGTHMYQEIMDADTAPGGRMT